MGTGFHGGFGKTKGSIEHSKVLQRDQQGKHIEGHKNYIQGRSIFLGSLDDAADLIKQFSGTGTYVGIGKERIDFGKVIGYYIDKETGVKYPTTMGIIHTSNKGSHIVPSKPKN